MRTALALAILMASGCAAFAGDTGPMLVIPSRPGVPIIIDGQDAAYAVVEGDWGLGKGVHVAPTIYPPHWQATYKPEPWHYYPHTGVIPGVGRLEIDTPPRTPQAESYFRSWSAESQPTPPTVTVPFNPPPIIVAPRDRHHGPHVDHNQPLNKQPEESGAKPAQEPSKE